MAMAVAAANSSRSLGIGGALLRGHHSERTSFSGLLHHELATSTCGSSSSIP
ncbi:hypothetical protein M6B38_388165 [Iris pallida]|uniref:Uncharacterized protein n=1 Tax=Iris pallida TaxID=29817 RepID=A0AAX6G2H1_IRIPA|nr:hypothetical protein M6B38_388165 [Iris pallida]